MHMWNMKALPHTNQKLWPRLKFLKSRSYSKVKGQKIKVLSKRSCQKGYTCEIWKPYHLPVKIYDQSYSFWKVDQTPRSNVRGSRSWYQMKGLTIRKNVLNMEALPPTKQTLWPRLKFLKRRSNSKVKGQSVDAKVSNEKSYQKEYTCQIWKPYHLLIKRYNQN
jgi:hypothetical protein